MPAAEVPQAATQADSVAEDVSTLVSDFNGLLAAGLRQGRSVEDAAVAAVWLHGTAGDRCAKRSSMAAMLPHDLFADLGTLFAELER